MTAHGRRQSGFTIVELAIVIIVAGVLAVIAIPIYIKFVDDAKWSQGEAALMRVRTALDAYLENGPPAEGDASADNPDGDRASGAASAADDDGSDAPDGEASAPGAATRRDLSQWVMKPATSFAAAIGLADNWDDDLTYFKPEDVVLDVAPEGDLRSGQYRLRINGSKQTSPKGTLSVTFDGEWTFEAP